MIEFFNFVANLKDTPRKGWITKGGLKNPESVADHTFAMTVMAMALADLNDLKTEKILKMSLLHDLAESITGDITPEQITKKEKTKLENNAICKILKKTPLKLQDKYIKIWQEFQKNKSKEAKFVHEIDKLEMALQAKIYSKNKLSVKSTELFLSSAKDQVQNPHLKKILNEISNQ